MFANFRYSLTNLIIIWNKNVFKTIFSDRHAFLMLLEVFRKVKNAGDVLGANAPTLLEDLKEGLFKLQDLEANFLSFLDKDFSKTKNQQHYAFLEAKKRLWHSICGLLGEIKGDYRQKYFAVP